MSTRQPETGEVCTCGRQAIVVYVTEEFGDVGYCGIPDGGQPQQVIEASLGRDG